MLNEMNTRPANGKVCFNKLVRKRIAGRWRRIRLSILCNKVMRKSTKLIATRPNKARQFTVIWDEQNHPRALSAVIPCGHLRSLLLGNRTQ